MRKRTLFWGILLIFCNILLITDLTNAKYREDSELNIYLTSAKMYFEDDANDVLLPYNNNTANMTVNVHNYLNDDFTIQNINYTVSISNSNYTFSINDVTAVNNSSALTLPGGQKNSQSLGLDFIRLDTTTVPATEDIEVTISTSFPYVYSKTFTVTILAGQIDVQGNPTEWTNNDVTLTVVPTTQGTTLTEYSFDGGTTWGSSSSNVYTANANNIEVYAKDQLGQILGPVVVDITKIDKEPPTLSFATVNEHWTDDVTGDLELKPVETLIVTLDEATSVLTGVTATDTQSGISSEGVKCYRNDTQITTTDYFTQVGRYLVTYKVQDNVGNETQVNREILVRWPTAGKYVVKRQNVVATGLSSYTMSDGLYKDNASTGANVALPFASKYYYTGKTVDNYITFAGTTFRILNIPTNDDIKVLGDVSDVKTEWGSSLETKNRKIYESNTFNTWSTKWWPRGQIYNHAEGEGKYKVFTDEEKAHLDLATFYAGRFNKADAVDISYTVYYEQTGGINLGGDNNPAFEGYSAYPNVSDYLKACKAHDIVPNIDESQSTALFGLLGKNKRQIFAENSWIDMSIDQWTMNSKNLTNLDNDFWVVDSTGGSNIQSRTFYINQQYRVVFYLKNDTILSGLGTTATPFNVEENWTWFDPNQILQ